MDRSKPRCAQDRCRGLFFAHRVAGTTPLIVLECCFCSRLWHRREDGTFVPYGRQLLVAVEDAT